MRRNKITILLIEEDPENANLYKKFLKRGEMSGEVTHASSLEEALPLLSQHTFKLIISALFLSDCSGLETFHRLRKAAPDTPIVILTRPIDEELALKTVSQGAQDYLPKSEITAQSLNRVSRSAIERHTLRESLKALTFTDELTKLYNRRGFIALTKQHIDLALRQKHGFHLFLIDLDHLKGINDTFGHLEGDKALVKTAESLNKNFRISDIISRIGGDEFAVIAINVPHQKGHLLKNHLLEIVKEWNATKEQPWQLSLSIGTAYFDPSQPTTIEKLMKLADQEMYADKKIHHEK
ncbi:MAG: putative diguanylate cyclase AdrA [Chlamydiae bacterium]|nr:putative diguanylate cyclase AdrA [Chlamydiota bacterium]